MRRQTPEQVAAAKASAQAARESLEESTPLSPPDPSEPIQPTAEALSAVNFARTKLAEAQNALSGAGTDEEIINPNHNTETTLAAREKLAGIPRQVTEEIDHEGNPTGRSIS